MEYTTIGNTIIPRLAVGTWAWGAHSSHLGEEDLRPVFERAVHAGLTLWDAPRSDGGSELLGKFAREQNRVLLSASFLPRMFQTPRAMSRALDRNLKQLGAEQLDLFWVHAPRSIETWVRELIPLLHSGKVRYVGVCNHSLREIQSVAAILNDSGLSLSAVQNHYSLLYRSPEQEGILRWCKIHNVPFFAYRVLEQGALSGHYTPEHPLPKHSRRGRSYPPIVLKKLEPLLSLLEEYGKRHRGDASQIAIAWAMAKGAVPIVGLTKPHQVGDEVRAMHIRLSCEEVALLERRAELTGVSIPCHWDVGSAD